MNPSPASLARATCFHHPQREAAARCVACGKSFCRECVTPVDRRMMCAGCHREATAEKVKPKRDFFIVSVLTQAALGLLLLWFTTYSVGRILLSLPTPFHEGTIWEKVIR